MTDLRHLSSMLKNEFPELDAVSRIAAAAGSHVEVRTLCEVAPGMPVTAITMGNPLPEVPAIGFIGGVHGLERIGAQVVIAYLESIVNRLRWDRILHHKLENLRLLFVPIVNPGGLIRRTRANPNGVDLMRNSPVEAKEPVPLLVGGQRISAALPWYRGRQGMPMEIESAALCQVVGDELLKHQFSVAVDCHSGFGVQDRIWFPFAHTREPVTHLAEVNALCELQDQSYSNHSYQFEPQSWQYLTHGDLWDHLYLQSIDNARGNARSSGAFIPLTLEMGSWLWIKKNPRQLFSRLGLFNPVVAHRLNRVLRRHLFWFEFMTRAVASCDLWLPRGTERELHQQRALARWYGGGTP
jgi:hypothetical protein